MHVALDMISAGTGFAPAAGGMTTYYEGLAANLPEAAGVQQVTAFLPAGIDHARIEERKTLVVTECEGIGESRLSRVAFEHVRFPKLVSASDADVLLSTHNVKPLRWKGPSVVVLQSIQWAILDDRIGRARLAYLKAAVPRSLRAADRVIAVSEATRRDAIELWDLDPERIVAVHHGCSPWATEAAERFGRDGVPPTPPPLPPGATYVLNVSSLYGLKNHRRLIEAFAEACRTERIEADLVIAGREADVTIAELRGLAEARGISGRVHLLGPYPQQHLPALIANARAIAYPSLYETFGHPVLEAFAFGRAVLTSNVGGSDEVAGDAAIKVDPESVESIAAGLTRLLVDDRLRTDLEASGRRRLGDFSWQRCAEGTAAACAAARSA